MCSDSIKVGDRVALSGGDEPRGIVQYCGEVTGTSGGVWVGIDWDDATRGKHNGSFKGVQYFKARTSTSGSFVRLNFLKTGTELISEISAKYADHSFFTSEPCQTGPSGDNRWEFIELNQVYDKQKNIFDLKCIVLTNLPVSYINNPEKKNFLKCIELDLAGTFLTKWSQLFKIISHFPNLQTLHLSFTRMEELDPTIQLTHNLPSLSQISLNHAFVLPQTANALTNIFSSIKEIYLAYNVLSFYAPTNNFENLWSVDLQGNKILQFARVSFLQSLSNLTFLNLSDCGLEYIALGEDPGFVSLTTLFISNNPISDWNTIEELSRLPALKKLLAKETKLLGTSELDVRELIIAKIPKLIELDRCDISEAFRQSTELYVLSRLVKKPIDPVHLGTIVRLENTYEMFDLRKNENLKNETTQINNFNSIRVILEFNGRSILRNMSLLLSIHRIVGIASKLFNFDPDEIEAVELRRKKLFAERLKRTKDCSLSQLDLEDDDVIAFLLD